MVTTDENPGYLESFQDIKNGFKAYLNSATYSNGDKFISSFNAKLLYEDFIEDLKKFGGFSLHDICLAIALGFMMTLIRMLATTFVFKPFASYLKFNKANSKKFPESMWKCSYYLLICSYLFYVMILSGNNDYFYKPFDIWNDYYQRQNVPSDVGIAFLLESSYYLHSLYGTLYMDIWRKDSPVMLFHHLLCLLLLGLSYSVRYYKVGILLMFLHDYADIFLEFSKCQVYMKYQNGKYLRRHDFLATTSFLMFTVAWFVGRLYLFPMMVLRSTGYSTQFKGITPPLPFYLIFNILLWFMFALNVYWFFLIMKFLYKVLSGQMKDLDDIRDYDVEDKIKKDCAAKQKHSMNGDPHSEIKSTKTPGNLGQVNSHHKAVMKRHAKKHSYN